MIWSYNNCENAFALAGQARMHKKTVHMLPHSKIIFAIVAWSYLLWRYNPSELHVLTGGPQCSGSSGGQKPSWDTGANTVTWYFSPASCRWSEFTNTSKWVGGWDMREHIQLARKLEVGKSLGRCSGTQRDRQGLIWSGISSQGKWCKVIQSEVGVCRHNESIFSSSSQDGRLTVADAAKLTPQSHPGDRQWPPSIS